MGDLFNMGNHLVFMAHVETSQLSQTELAELACSYAALILHDDGQDITSDKLNKLIKAANVKVENYWAKYFAKALSGKDISSFFNFGGSSAPAASAPAASSSAPAAAGKPAASKEPEPAPPAEEEEDMDMGDLFG